MKKFLITIVAVLCASSALASEVPVTVVGVIENFDAKQVVLDVRGTKVRLPRTVFRKDMALVPGKRTALALPLSMIKAGVIRSPRKAR